MGISTQHLKRVSAGEPVRAALFNALVDAVVALANEKRGGPQMQMLVEARITAVYGNPTEDLASNVFYDVEAKGGEFTLTRVAPDYGRPFDETDIRIRPARQNARCLVLRFTDDAGEPSYHLWLPFGGKGERLAPNRCGQTMNRMTVPRQIVSAGGTPAPAPDAGPGPDVGGGGDPIGGGVIS